MWGKRHTKRIRTIPTIHRLRSLTYEGAKADGSRITLGRADMTHYGWLPFARWLKRWRASAPKTGSTDPYAGQRRDLEPRGPLTNPYEQPETPEALMRRRLGHGECPDCQGTTFYDQGAMKGPTDQTPSTIKFMECAKCGSKFKIQFIDHPLLPIVAERVS